MLDKGLRRLQRKRDFWEQPHSVTYACLNLFTILRLKLKKNGNEKNLPLLLSAPPNRPFLRCPKPLFQSEAICDAIVMKMIFYSHAKKTHFCKKGFALCLVLKVRVLETPKS